MYKKKRAAESLNSNNKKQQFTAFTTTDNLNSSEPWKHVVNDAQQAFRENKFKDAVALFTRAISLNPNNTTLLDCRAASYEKLNQIDLARLDASAMIKMAPNESRGYLRAGKIFSLQKKYKNAITVYKHALAKVSLDDARYGLLKSMKANAEKLASPPPCFDPIKKLPYDLLSIVFSMLSFDRRIQCMRVSKDWNRFSTNWSGMWKDLDFGSRKVPMTTIKRYMERATGRHVRRFAKTDADQNTMKKILQLLIDQNCQYIDTIDFARCEIPINTFLRMLRLAGKHVKVLRLDDARIQLSTVIEHVLPMCPKLTHLSLLGLEDNSSEPISIKIPVNVTHLRISINERDTFALLTRFNKLQLFDFYTPNIHFEDMAEILASDSFPDLKTFYFSYRCNEYRLRTKWMSITTEPTATLVKKTFTFGIYGDPSFNGNHLNLVVSKYHDRLEALDISDCQSVDHSLANLALTPGLPVLSTLCLKPCIYLERDHLQNLIQSCSTLQDITITYNMSLDDLVMESLARNTTRLKRLDISGCNSVTGRGLSKFVKVHKDSLEKLVLNNCQKIAPDAVKWAIGQLGQRAVECKYNV